MLCRLFCCALVSLTILPAQDGFNFSSFAGANQFSLVKDARRAGNSLRVVSAAKNKTGAVWMTERQPLGFGFETTFRFMLTQQDGDVYAGADGFAFVVQNVGPSVIAGRGAAGGFAIGRGDANPKTRGIPRSLAVFFDTYQNREEDDPSNNYVALYTNGDGHFLPRQLARSEFLPINMKDRQQHTVKIAYAPPLLRVYLDDISEPVLSASIELSSVIGSEGTGFIGFTAATGEGFQNHDILSWSFVPNRTAISSSIQFQQDSCLPNRTLCTPESAKVEEKGQGRFHVMLPANLEWGASIANPQARLVRVTMAKGTVCWNPQAQNAHACNGPEGEAGQGKLIQQNRNGRTYFSINAPAATYEKNEGFFEFDVEIAERYFKP